jgi:hypothetical protein
MRAPAGDVLAGLAQGTAVVATGAGLGGLIGGVAGRVLGHRGGCRVGDAGGARRRGAAIGGAVSALWAVPYGRAIARTGPYRDGARGVRRFVVDLSWSSLNTWAGALYYTSHAAVHHHVDEERSRATGALWIVEGVAPRYATTIGIVKAGSTDHVDAHEMVHVFQARLLGPLYLPSVGLNYVLASVIPFWLLYHDRDRWPITGVASYFLNGVYPNVWNEFWAYRTTG